MAQNPQMQQQFQRISQQISQSTESIVNLIGQTDPSDVRQKGRLEKAIKLQNVSGHLVQKYIKKASKQKLQKQSVANGQEEQGYQSQPQSQQRRWQQETAMQQ